jgi:MoaA/NifB/PqqE/SkfB family radical SAM enzyme
MNWSEVKGLHLEISGLCNAVCPGCARYPTQGYFTQPGVDNKLLWTVEETKKRFPVEDLTNIRSIWFNGTVGDFLANPESLEIVKYFKLAGVKNININTNASSRPPSYWQALGELKVNINFALDGLSDTHSLYRRETNFEVVLNNAKEFIRAGGTAIWTMTVFEHNKHQIEECKQLSIELGFKGFEARPNNRGVLNVFDKDKSYAYTLEAPSNSNTSHNLDKTPPANTQPKVYYQKHEDRLIKNFTKKEPRAKIFVPMEKGDSIVCHSFNENYSIYVSSAWQVSPCCFIGHEILLYPRNQSSLEYSADAWKIYDLRENTITVKQSWEAMNNWKFVSDGITDHTKTFSNCSKNCKHSSSFTVGKKETTREQL